MNNTEPLIDHTARPVLIDGVTLGEWAFENNFSCSHLYKLINKGITLSQLKHKAKNHKRNKTKVFYEGKEWGIKELFGSTHNKSNVSFGAFYHRVITLNWSLEKALITNSANFGKKKTIYYKGKEYSSQSELCDHLGMRTTRFSYYLKICKSIDEVVEKTLSERDFRLQEVTYKGKVYGLKELSIHPDNIHKLPPEWLKTRITSLNKSRLDIDENLFKLPNERPTFKFTYKGVEYTSIRNFIRKNNMTYGDSRYLYGCNGNVDLLIKKLDLLMEKKAREASGNK